MNDYLLLLKHNIIGSKTNPNLENWEKSSEDDAGCIMTFLVDRMAMADEKVDDGEGQMWNPIQNVEEFRTSFDNIHFIDEGSLFPSTYFYVYGTDMSEMINKMQISMKMVLEESWRNRDKDVKLKNYKEPNELLSMVNILMIY